MRARRASCAAGSSFTRKELCSSAAPSCSDPRHDTLSLLVEFSTRVPAPSRAIPSSPPRHSSTADATGRIIDFHWLRTTFVTWLGLAGAHPRTAQGLARHRTTDLTMRVCTGVRLLDLRAAVDRLPLPALVAAPPALDTGKTGPLEASA